MGQTSYQAALPRDDSIIICLTEQKVKPFLEIATLLLCFVVNIRVFCLGFFGVVRQNNHGFAREHFVLFLARHDFLIFVSVKILLFERKGFNLNFKLGGFERALFEFLLELPVARCCRNGIIGKNETEDDSTGGSNIVDRQKVLLREVTEATETGPQFIHKLIIPQRPRPIRCFIRLSLTNLA